MKKQYRYHKTAGFQYMLQLYCDGWLVKSYKVYFDELDDEIDKIESQGYVYGYSENELKSARERYEHILNNIIVKEDRQ